MALEVQVLHNVDCPSWSKAVPVVEEVLTEAGLEPRTTVTLVRDQKEADEMKFSGSPTIKFNGVDVDPLAQKITKYNAVGCRIYIWEGKAHQFPPKAMLEQALKKALEK